MAHANAYAERFVRTIKYECLNCVIPFGERHLGRTIAEFMEHYHAERDHQGLGNELITGSRSEASGRTIYRQLRLGGLLTFYTRAA